MGTTSIIAKICQSFNSFDINNIDCYTLKQSEITYEEGSKYLIIYGRAFEIFTNEDGFKAISLNTSLEKILFLQELEKVEETLEFYDGEAEYDPTCVEDFMYYKDLYDTMLTIQKDNKIY